MWNDDAWQKVPTLLTPFFLVVISSLCFFWDDDVFFSSRRWARWWAHLVQLAGGLRVFRHGHEQRPRGGEHEPLRDFAGRWGGRQRVLRHSAQRVTTGCCCDESARLGPYYPSRALSLTVLVPPPPPPHVNDLYHPPPSTPFFRERGVNHLI